MIKEEFIEKIQDYLEKHYEAENWGVIGKSGKVLTFFEKTEIFFKKLFGSFDGYFFWYLRKLMKKKNLTELQLIEKANLNENYFSDLRNGKYVEIRSEEIWAISLALQLDFKDVNKLFDLVGCRKLYIYDVRDLIVAFFIENKIDDVSLLNDTLDHYKLKNLSGRKQIPDNIKNLVPSIDYYIEENYHEEIKFSISFDEEDKKIISQLEHRFEEDKKSFSEYLFELIQQKNLSEVEVYKKAHLDRRVFSKLRNEKNYKPSKKTILLIAFGMKLNLNEAEKLLKLGGYALSDAEKFDLIMKYFFENEIYDLFLINEVLDYYDFKPIGD